MDLLDRHYAAVKEPIRLGKAHSFAAKCIPLPSDRVDWLEESYPTAQLPPELTPLRDGLLKMGGQFALLPMLEEDLDSLLGRGQLWGATGKMMRGAPSRCHSNSCFLFEANQHLDMAVATGYALSDDGLWRQHSWCVQRNRKGHTLVVETTEPRLLYFGYVMDLQETRQFACDNTDFGIDIEAHTQERFESLNAGGAEHQPSTALRPGAQP